MTCPQSAITCISYFPCMWAIVNSVSYRSAPAKNSIFFVWRPKKLDVSPLNHSVQYSFVASKSVRHTYFYNPVAWSVTCLTYAGIDTLALRLSLTCPPRTPYFTTDYRSGKWTGRFFTICSMNGSASIAVPSTTSIIATPRIHFYSSEPYMSLSIWATVLVAIAPPIEWPIRRIDRSWYFSWTWFNTSSVSLMSVS